MASRLQTELPRKLVVAATTLVITALVAMAAGAVVIFSGVVNIAATVPEMAITRWVLHETMENSVKRHAAAIVAPLAIDDKMVDEGFHHFREMCVTCHGAPGVKRSEIGEGLRPTPPDLVKVAPGLSGAETFWIIKNGIRMTGMPAFVKGHTEAELWGIVTVVKRLPSLSAEAYRTWEQADKQRQGGHRHDHHEAAAGHH